MSHSLYIILSNTEWRRLKLLAARVGVTFLIFTKLPLLDLQISSLSSTNSVPTATTTLMTAFLAPSVSSTSIAHNLQEWPTNSACSGSPRECIKLQYPYNQILTYLASEEYRLKFVERKTSRPTCIDETHAFLRAIPYKPQLTMAPDRFRNAFRIRSRLALPFGTDHTCSCEFSLRDENDSHTLRCNAHCSNYACHNATLAFVKSLARDAGYHAQKGDCCVRESSPSADGVRADGFIALADEDPSKYLIIDVCGSDPSNISFIRASSNILFEKAFEAGYKKKDATYRGLVNDNNATVLSWLHHLRFLLSQSPFLVQSLYTNNLRQRERLILH
jgi:hypothetical protein